MANFTSLERARYVQEMFARIAHRYDLMNRLMTAAQDVRWRREVIRRARLPPRGRLLDLGTGTGDLALEAGNAYPQRQIVAVDFSPEMMQVGQHRPGAGRPDWTVADALQLPFPSDVFDTVISGFLLRNLTDLHQSLIEQYRVLKADGTMVALDTTRPKRNLLSPFIDFHLHKVIPALGRLVTGDIEAYTYLPDSSENFLGAEELAARIVTAGFVDVGFRRLMFGTVAIHWGVKPA